MPRGRQHTNARQQQEKSEGKEALSFQLSAFGFRHHAPGPTSGEEWTAIQYLILIEQEGGAGQRHDAGEYKGAAGATAAAPGRQGQRSGHG